MYIKWSLGHLSGLANGRRTEALTKEIIILFQPTFPSSFHAATCLQSRTSSYSYLFSVCTYQLRPSILDRICVAQIKPTLYIQFCCNSGLDICLTRTSEAY